MIFGVIAGYLVVRMGTDTTLPLQGMMALLWVLNLSDGRHSLLDIAERAEMPFTAIRAAADALCATDLLSLVNP